MIQHTARQKRHRIEDAWEEAVRMDHVLLDVGSGIASHKSNYLYNRSAVFCLLFFSITKVEAERERWDEEKQALQTSNSPGYVLYNDTTYTVSVFFLVRLWEKIHWWATPQWNCWISLKFYGIPALACMHVLWTILNLFSFSSHVVRMTLESQTFLAWLVPKITIKVSPFARLLKQK